MKRVVFLIDGAADHPVPAMHGKTPLQMAEIPHMDRIARQGVAGLGYLIRIKKKEASSAALTVLKCLKLKPVLRTHEKVFGG